MSMKQMAGPFVSIGALKQVAQNTQEMFYAISGQVTADMLGCPVGVAKIDGVITLVGLGVTGSGRDTSNALTLEADVKINGTTAMTTKAKINKNSGEAKSTLASTLGSGDVAGVVDPSAAGVNKGDVITVDLDLTRTATPTYEITGPMVAVILEPKL